MNQLFKTSFHPVAALLLAFCLFIISHASFGQATETATMKRLQVGDTAPDITLDDFNGKPFQLSEHSQKKGVVLWFTNLCGGCQSQMSIVEKMKKRYVKKGIEIVAISQLGADRETVEKTIREKKLTFRFLYDPKGEATTQFCGKYVPGSCPLKNMYFIKADRTISSMHHYPGMEEKEFTQLLNDLLKGKIL